MTFIYLYLQRSCLKFIELHDGHAVRSAICEWLTFNFLLFLISHCVSVAVSFWFWSFILISCSFFFKICHRSFVSKYTSCCNSASPRLRKFNVCFACFPSPSDPWWAPRCSSFHTQASVNTCLPWTGCESALTVYLCVCRCVVHVCGSVDICAQTDGCVCLCLCAYVR